MVSIARVNFNRKKSPWPGRTVSEIHTPTHLVQEQFGTSKAWRCRWISTKRNIYGYERLTCWFLVICGTGAGFSRSWGPRWDASCHQGSPVLHRNGSLPSEDPQGKSITTFPILQQRIAKLFTHDISIPSINSSAFLSKVTTSSMISLCICKTWDVIHSFLNF